MKIMFICTGNICRSAMAHKMLEKKAKEQNKDVEVYSCGIWAQNGDIPTYEGIKTMSEYGIDLSMHRATNISNSNIEKMDVILCATLNHKRSVISMYPELKDKIYTMKEYAMFPENDLDIADPWGYGLDVYKKCAKEIEICIEKILEKI